ncbi:MAG TPA: RING finger protein, partial [Clostridiales bacterium]|nr:RING finger protein [Clostridiales bacterium]
MNFWQGKICPVCKKEFNDKDDIVYCPECGTAHHRECWNQNGACFFAPEHANGNFDTTNELTAPSGPSKTNSVIHGVDENGKIICDFCGYHNDPMFRVCLNCGHELTLPNPEFKATPNYPPPPGSNAYNDG